MDELIEIAARILSQHWRDMSTNMSLDRQRMLAGHVVPVIAAQALRDAVDTADEAYAQEDVPLGAYGNGYIDGVGTALDYIRSRAARIEREVDE